MDFPIELGLIILFSVIGGIIAVRFKQPSIVGLLIIGAIVGPFNLGWIKDTNLLSIVTEVGAVLLLFTVGIEFSINKLLRYGLKSVIIGSFKLGGVFLITYFISLFFGLSTLASLYLGVILAITSTVIFLRILAQKNMAKKEEVPLLVSILIIEDIFGIFAITFFSSINTVKDFTLINVVTNLVISLSVLLFVYIVLRKILKPIINWMVKYSAEETITFLSLGICGAMVYFSILLNLSPTVGAFLAGNIVASLPQSKKFEHAIHPFLLTFTSMFFFSIGAVVDFSALSSYYPLIIVFSAVLLIRSFVFIGSGTYIFGNFNGKQSVFSAISMLSVGEFSLLIANESKGLDLGIDLVSITAMLILISSLLMSFMLSKQDYIYKSLKKSVSPYFLEKLKVLSTYANSISFKAIKNQVNMSELKSNWKKLSLNTMMLLFVSLISFLIWRFFWNTASEKFQNMPLLYVFVEIFFVVLLFPIINIFNYVKKLFSEVLAFFINPYTKEKSKSKKLFRTILLVPILFFLLVFFPISIIFLKLPVIYNIFDIILLMILVFLVIKSWKLAFSIIRENKNTFKKIFNKSKEQAKEQNKKH